MKQIFKFYFFLTIVALVFLGPLLFRKAEASELGESYLFLERMQADAQTDMILLITPSTDFNSALEDRSIKIIFSGNSGDWCKVDGTVLTVAGVFESAIDIEDWVIDESLPGSLSARCLQNAGGDYIEITGIDFLDGETKYGLKISKNANFILGAAGTHQTSTQLLEDIKLETKTFPIDIIVSDHVTVSANVLDIGTLTCTLSHNSVSFGALSKDANYATVQHTAHTSASLLEGYYWAVFGQGNGIEAGLWKPTPPSSLIPSTGSTTVNLNTNHGFGLVVTSPHGNVRPHFLNTHPGIFGAINSGYENARLIFTYTNPEYNPLVQTMTLGVKAGPTAEAGAYSETLTYICGGFY